MNLDFFFIILVRQSRFYVWIVRIYEKRAKTIIWKTANS